MFAVSLRCAHPSRLESNANHEDDKEDENKDTACLYAHASLFSRNSN